MSESKKEEVKQVASTQTFSMAEVQAMLKDVITQTSVATALAVQGGGKPPQAPVSAPIQSSGSRLCGDCGQLTAC